MNPADRPAYWNEIRLVMFAAMAIFLYTIGIGILNGTDLVEFDQRRILGHVHGGTLGWLTLSVFAASFWLFGGKDEPSPTERMLVRLIAVGGVLSFAFYIHAFSTTYGNYRPTMGGFSLLFIAAAFAWVVYRAMKIELGVPHWGFLAAMGTSIAGGVLGVLLGLEIATGDNWLPDGGEDAHPGTMVVGFLIPVALAMAEWAFFFPYPPKATRLGIIQMVFPFVGGLVLMTSLLLDIVPLAPLSIILELIGIGIFVKRLWPNFRALDLKLATSTRYGLLSGIWMAWTLILAQYFIIQYEGDFDLVPTNELLALDHSQFIGGMTNAVFAMLLAATMARGRGNNWDQIVFALVNVGILGFMSGLLFDVTALKRTFAPIMGVGLLLGLGLFAWRLYQAGREEPAVAEVAAAPAGQ